MPPKTRVPPCTAMPFMIAPMPCSRMPKCSTRPASGSPFHILVARLVGQERRRALDGGVVGPGQVGRAAPQLGQLAGDRVDHRAGGLAGGHALRVGRERRAVARPSRRAGCGSAAGRSRAASAEGLRGPRVELRRPTRPAPALPRSTQPGGCARCTSGRRPRRSGRGRSRGPSWWRRPRRRRARSRGPCRCSARSGAGQAMIVWSTMKLGRSVTACGLADRVVQRRARPPRTSCRRWSSRRAGRASRRPRSARRRPR